MKKCSKFCKFEGVQSRDTTWISILSSVEGVVGFKLSIDGFKHYIIDQN